MAVTLCVGTPSGHFASSVSRFCVDFFLQPSHRLYRNRRPPEHSPHSVDSFSEEVTYGVK
ncbi:Uncharacterized protein dnm_097210 [Desulfonema magnum]|uniref:Uncharacterized protein n=1 Tax=Desulfonema magnum TaxID=45655 RepID=A0A975BY18_9BACT|nr:Uncharacterized protein dnm_097210 [Desulfonema magnum]